MRSSESPYAAAGTHPPWPPLLKGGSLCNIRRRRSIVFNREFSTAHPCPPAKKGGGKPGAHSRREISASQSASFQQARVRVHPHSQTPFGQRLVISSESPVSSRLLRLAMMAGRYSRQSISRVRSESLTLRSKAGWGLVSEVGVGEVGDFSGMAIGFDQIGVRTLPAAGPTRLCRTGLGARRVSMKGFTFEMIRLSRASGREDTLPNLDVRDGAIQDVEHHNARGDPCCCWHRPRLPPIDDLFYQCRT